MEEAEMQTTAAVIKINQNNILTVFTYKKLFIRDYKESFEHKIFKELKDRL